MSYKEGMDNSEAHLDGLFVPQDPRVIRSALLNHLPSDAIYSGAEAL